MSKRRQLQPQSIFDETALFECFDNNNVKREHAFKIWRFFLRNPGATITEFCDPSVPKAAHNLIHSNFVPFTSKVIRESTSTDRSTTKLLVKLQDGSLVETVIMRYDRKNSSQKARNAVCISSQVGCKMGCTFCATGTMGFTSHLTPGEILEQLVHANQIEPIRSVVFMGMGEPLDNYEAVITSVHAMTDVRRFGLAASRICISTVGVIPRMKQLLKDAPGVSLALSLHAPTQEMRCRIVPTAKAYPLDKIMETLDLYLDIGHRIMIEYILIGNVNMSIETAHTLGKLLRGKNFIVNLIPYNPTDVSEDFVAPIEQDIIQFEQILQKDYGLLATVRRTMGQDIDGACGQLVVKSKLGCSSPDQVNDIEDLVKSSPSSKKKGKVVKNRAMVNSNNQNTNTPFVKILASVAGISLLLLLAVRLNK